MEKVSSTIKRKKTGRLLYWIGALLAILLLISQEILANFHLTYRMWPAFFLGCFLSVMLIASIIRAFRCLKRQYQKSRSTKGKNFAVTIIAAIGMAVLITCSPMALLPPLTVVGPFFYKPEHVVVKYDTKMVANVTSWLDTFVSYYPYYNFLVRGTDEIGYESYPSCGHDPLANSSGPIPSYYSFSFQGKDGWIHDSYGG